MNWKAISLVLASALMTLNAASAADLVPGSCGAEMAKLSRIRAEDKHTLELEIRDEHLIRERTIEFGSSIVGGVLNQRITFSFDPNETASTELVAVEDSQYLAQIENAVQTTNQTGSAVATLDQSVAAPTDAPQELLDFLLHAPEMSEWAEGKMIDMALESRDLNPRGYSRAQLVALMKSGKKIALSTAGADRFFWFTPDGSTRPMPARVLQIIQRSGATIIAIEWLDLADTTELLSRRVRALTTSELKSIKTDHAILNNSMAAQLFDSALSPQEMITKKIAKSLGLAAYGFNPSVGRFNRTGDEVVSVLDVIHLTDLFNLVEFNHVIERYGDSYRAYLTPEELEQYGDLDANSEPHLRGTNGVNLYNIHDILNRVSAADYFRIFGERNPEYAHKWVITEDGRLIIVPTMSKPEVGSERSPYSMTFQQLSFGKKVFAAGDLHIEPNGSIHVRMSSYELEQGVDHWNNQTFAFGLSGTDYVNAFINEVFRAQAGVDVAYVNYDRPVALSSLAKKEGEHETVFGFSPADDFYEFGVDHDEFRFFTGEEAGTEAASNRVTPRPSSISWDPDQTAIPLSQADWASETGSSPSDSINWAMYVLGLDQTVSFAEGKRKYRGYAVRFHPDTNQDNAEDAEEALKLINGAWDIFKEVYE
ncbi:MAG: J domain-containing protein [Bdellovibrionales bacterium]|nr:J domain-containing protein [Bdellovibrionales bacterium]